MSRSRARRDRFAAALALTGASLGVLAGVVELTVGPSIRAWVGDKQDTTRLGVTTTLLGLIALVAAAELRRPGHAGGERRVGVAVGLLAPALVCFTTVGRLWYLPGALLLAAGALVVAGTRREELAAGFSVAHWRIVLLACCGVFYVFLGATALGPAGVLGVLGGVLIWAVAPLARRSPGSAYAALAAGALPFAAATWWSAVTPFIALLALALGAAVIRRSTRTLGAPVVNPGWRATA